MLGDGASGQCPADAWKALGKGGSVEAFYERDLKYVCLHGDVLPPLPWKYVVRWCLMPALMYSK